MLRMQLLGGLHLTLHDDLLTGFISVKAQALLCYLAINQRQPHLRSTLAAMFWGDMPDEDAATNLRQVIANLKKLLEPYLDITRQTVAFKTDVPCWIDVESFEASLDPQLYRGELLAGFGLSDAPPFDEWLTTERERLHELVLSALHKQAATQHSNNQNDAAIASLQRLVAIEPLDEDAHRQLMLLLALNGQRSAALAQYDACRDLLARELGVEPEAETTRFYQRIKIAKKLSALPIETTPFMGRENELTQLRRRLADPTCHLVTIAGIGGIGKTRLAQRLAHICVNQMLHGAVMVNLTAVHTLESFLSTLADELGLSLSREGGVRPQVLNYLREKHLLLVLDNFEQLIGNTSDFLSELMRTAVDVKTVITSRERLNLWGEWVLALHGLPFAENTYQPDQPPAAQALFWETAHRVRGDELITNQSSLAVTRICNLVQGMPLAIELAAAWTRLLTCEELAEEIATNLTALEATTRDSNTRHHSLRAVFDQSWLLFSMQEQRALMALSTFVAGFTRDAAEKVAKASLPMLLSLSDKMLIRQEANNRFSLHEMMRQYLYEKLQQSTDFTQVQTAFVDYYVQYLSEREPRLKSFAQLDMLDEISWEIDNIHVAWDTAITSNDGTAILCLMPGIATYHDFKSNWDVGELVLQRAEVVINPLNVTAYGDWLSQLALFSSGHDQPEAIERSARRCLQVLSRENPQHQVSIARALIALGYWERLHGNYAAAIQNYRQAFEIRTELHDDWGCAECCLSLGSAYGRSGADDEAWKSAQQGIEISLKLGDRFQLAHLQTLLATLAERAGRLDEAEQLYRNALVTYEQLKSLEGRALSFNGLGNIAFFRKDLAPAQTWYLEALALNRQLGKREWEGGTLNNLGEVTRLMGDTRAALEYFRNSQDVFRQLGHQNYVNLLQQEIETTQQQMTET